MAQPPDARLMLTAQLRRGGADAIATLVRRVPVFADAIAGRGPFAMMQHWGVTKPGPQPLENVATLADYLARETPTRLRLLHANRNEFQLMSLAAFDNGVLDQQLTRRALGLKGDRVGQRRLDQAADGLRELMLSDPDAGWVALAPGVADFIPLPSIPFRHGAANITKDHLAAIARTMQIRAPGTRKAELVDAIEAALRDVDKVVELIAALSPEARTLLAALGGRGVVGYAAIGVSYYRDSVLLSRANNQPPRDRAFHELVSMGLVGVAQYDRTCWIWLDVELASADGDYYESWDVPQASALPITTTSAVALPPVMTALDAVLDAITQSPVKALKTGGLGVQSVRTIAKARGRRSAEVGLLASIAIELGLIGLVVLDQRGRGRNITIDHGWQPDPERVAAWKSLPAWARFARLAQQWIDSPQLPSEGVPIERFEPRSRYALATLGRGRMLALLADAAPDEGYELADLTAMLTFAYPHWFTVDVAAQFVAEARVLGLVPTSGPIGLTAAARLALADAPSLAESLAGSPTSFTVQADHTVIAPPGLDPDLDARLARLAVVESDAGARIYRITEASVGVGLDSGLTADEIIDFLREHSTVEIAANVERTIRDAADRHGRLRVGTTTTWIACDDPVQLMRAIAVKAAKLTMISPTAAISPLPEDKLLAALRAKGVAPARTEVHPAPRQRLRRGGPTNELGPRAALLTDLSRIDALAKQIIDAPFELVSLPDPQMHRHQLLERLRETSRTGGNVDEVLDEMLLNPSIWDESDDFDDWEYDDDDDPDTQ